MHFLFCTLLMQKKVYESRWLSCLTARGVFSIQVIQQWRECVFEFKHKSHWPTLIHHSTHFSCFFQLSFFFFYPPSLKTYLFRGKMNEKIYIFFGSYISLACVDKFGFGARRATTDSELEENMGLDRGGIIFFCFGCIRLTRGWFFSRVLTRDHLLAARHKNAPVDCCALWADQSPSDVEKSHGVFQPIAWVSMRTARDELRYTGSTRSFSVITFRKTQRGLNHHAFFFVQHPTATPRV